MKKIISLALAVTMAVSLTACGGNSNSAGGQEPKVEEGSGQGADSQGAETISKQTIKITHPQPEGTPEDMAIKTMAEKIEELSDGAIQCEVYPNGQIGSIPESIQSVQMGVTQIAMGPCAIIASYCEDMALMDMPYLLPQDTSVISQVLNDDVGREFLDRLDSVGIHGMAFWFAGFRLMSSNTDINSVDDMKNMKMRIMESNILTSTYKALGAQPIVIAYAETYNALQNGTVDGQENPAQSIYTMNFHEVQKYLVDTYHDAQTHVLMVNGAWWNKQDDATKAIITEAEIAARKVLDEELPGYTQDCIDKMVEAGSIYHALTDEQVKEFKEATSVVYDEFLTTDWRKGYIPRLQEAFDQAVAAKQ
ncbi:TRAP transporter substrate-binding protein [Lachnoclostridium edouardi]|uniref:TRAP transporter substrate-binding protein n=1 Tax=Lachnoclostridium edouardi TaxID=1926283 RepID=UPI000C79C1F6|nr:TRAP transporter substrate-binding protein [Lachnoclostridium edouardi]